MDKKGFVSMHPMWYLIIGLIIGAIIMYYLILNGIIPVNLPVK